MSVNVKQEECVSRYPKRARHSGNEKTFDVFSGPFKEEHRDSSGFYPDDPRVLVVEEPDGSKALVDAEIPGARYWKIGDPNLDGCIVCKDASSTELMECRTCVRSVHWRCLPKPGFHDRGTHVYCNICVDRGWHLVPPEDIRPTGTVIFDSPSFVPQNAVVSEHDDSSDPPFTPRRKPKSVRSFTVQSSHSESSDEKFEAFTPTPKRKASQFSSTKSVKFEDRMPRSYDSPGSARSERVKKKLPARLENVFTKLRSECLGAIDDRSIALDTRVKHLEQLLKDQKDQKRQIIDDNRSEKQSLVARLSEKEQMLKEQREEIQDLKSRLQDSEELSQRRAKEMQLWRSNISGMLEFSL